MGWRDHMAALRKKNDNESNLGTDDIRGRIQSEIDLTNLVFIREKMAAERQARHQMENDRLNEARERHNQIINDRIRRGR
jgi:hypothetical protein